MNNDEDIPTLDDSDTYIQFDEDDEVPFREKRFKTLQRVLWFSLSSSLATVLLITFLPSLPINGVADSVRTLELLLSFLLTSSTTIIGVFIGSSIDRKN